MENITLGAISSCLAFVVALIGSIEFLYIRFTRRFNKDITEVVTKELKPILNEINNIKLNVSNLEKEQTTNELDRIRYEILQFSGSLRNGLQRTQNDYQHIEEIFEKYEKKGGNSYIHSEMEFIRSCRNKNVDKSNIRIV